MKVITRLIEWVRAQIAAIQAAHHEAARNLVLRLSMAFLTWKFIGDTWDAGSLTLWSPNSRSAAVATMLGGDWVGWLFIAMSLAMMPFMLSELCWWVGRHRRAHSKLAMLAFGISGALYLLLVMVSRNTELTLIKQTYTRTGIECIAMMLLIGTLLNAQLRAEYGLDDFVSESNRVPLEPSAG